MLFVAKLVISAQNFKNKTIIKSKKTKFIRRKINQVILYSISVNQVYTVQNKHQIRNWGEGRTA